MSEAKPIFTIVKRGSAYESRHITPEPQEQVQASYPVFESPTARRRKNLQAAIQSLVEKAKDEEHMARTTVGFDAANFFTPRLF